MVVTDFFTGITIIKMPEFLDFMGKKFKSQVTQ